MAHITNNKLILILLISSTLATLAAANKDWYNHTTNWPWWWWRGPTNQTDTPNTILVGGTNQWRFGYNYSVWAFQNFPIYVNDVLLFKYDAPNETQPFAHSVYELPNMWSYMTCDLSKAKLIANTTQGGGDGFKFKLEKWKPYYFACGERGGLHCGQGGMKFFVMPLLRRWR